MYSIKSDDNLDPVMFIGADVAHGGNSGGGESVAAVVGSRDLNFYFYCAQISVQRNENRGKKSQEIILDMEKMCQPLVEKFIENTKQSPKRIIFFRDGVDYGQFEAVIEKEVSAIKNAVAKISSNPDEPKPKVTTILVQKRNHTRFYPVHEKDQVKEKRRINLYFFLFLIQTLLFTYYSHKRETFCLVHW